MRLILGFLVGCLLAVLVPVAPLLAQDVRTVSDLQTTGSAMGVAAGSFTLYSLRDERIVPQKDSASAAWDIGFRSTTIIVNGGTSGPGEGAAAVITLPFEEVTSPPADSLFRTDGDNECPQGTYAICTGSLNGWYNYAGSGGVNPLSATTLVIRLAEGGFAKVRIMKYEMVGDARQYMFEYVLF